MPTITFLHGDGRRKDYALRPAPTEGNHLAVASGAGTFYLDLTPNGSISDTSTVFVHTPTGGHYYPKTVYDLVFGEQSFRGFNGLNRLYEFDLYFEQAGSRFQAHIAMSGDRTDRVNVNITISVLAGPAPREIRYTFRAVSESGEQTMYRSNSFPGSGGYHHYIERVYIYSTMYMSMTAYM